MYTISGRGMQVGRGENRSLGFYGVGKLAGLGDDPTLALPGLDVTGLVSTTPLDTSSANTYINSGGGDSSTRVDPNTGLALYVQSYSNPYPAPVPLKTTSNNTTMIMLAVAAVGLMIALKR